MERKSGMAAIAVLVAVLGFSFVPRGGESARPAEAAKGTQTARRAGVAKVVPSKVQAACKEISDRVGRFYEKQVQYPRSCYADNADNQQTSKAAPDLKFAIALVPNPAQTNLPVVFDRLIEAIQQAAQDENYSYDGSWFPWSEEKSYDRFGDQEKAEALQSELQQQPGVLAFRRNGAGKSGNATGTDPAGKNTKAADKSDRARDDSGPYQGGLLVFVVGEQPTGGIDDEQFENAMQWLKKLGADPATKGLRILGPTFSGSLPSLQRELGRPDVAAQYLDKVTVYSGTANSNESIDGFKRFLCHSDTKNPTDCHRFRTFLESDKLMTHRFLQFVNQSCYHVERVAILSEDETAFGAEVVNQPDDETDGSSDSDDSECKKAKADDLEKLPIQLYYPRDIATLRSAYSKQSIFSQGKQQNNAPSSTLRGDPGEAAGSGHDTVQTYAGELTPYAQEATLFGIVNVLQAKHIQFIVIRSSNSLDQLFLAEFLRRSYPTGRVVLDGADLLFRRGMQGDSLRGVMLLSTYPLLSWTQDQIRPVRFLYKNGDDKSGDYEVAGAAPNSYRLFGDELSEGAYVAARGLFGTGSPDTRGISDYGPPKSVLSDDKNDDDLRPATWLTVVGHRQFWPIAVLNDKTLGLDQYLDPTETNVALLSSARSPHPEPEVQSNPAGTTGEHNKGAGAKPSRAFPPDTTALVLFCCALALAHFLLCWKGRMIGAPRVRAYFAPIPLAQQPALIFVGSLLLGALAVTIGGMTGLVEGFYSGHQAWGLWSALVLLVLCGFGGFVANYRMCPLAAAEENGAEKKARASQQEVARGVAAGAEHAPAIGATPTLPSDRIATNRRVESEVASGGAEVSQDATATPHPKRTKVNRSGLKHFWAVLIARYNYVRDLVLKKLRYVRDLVANRDVPWWFVAAVWLAALAVMVVIRWHLNDRLTPVTQTSAFWRNSHISNGVSGLLPQVLLILGFYAWFWYNLRGLSLFGEDRPLLPGRDSLPESFHEKDDTIRFESQDDRHDRKLPSDPSGARLFAMFSAEQAGALIEEAAHPLDFLYLWSYPLILIATMLLCWLTLGEQTIQTLGDRAFGRMMFAGMSVAIALVLADTWQFARAWGRLHQLLVLLDRLRLRRTLAALKGLSWSSVLSMTSNVLEERYCLISRQLESARNLQAALQAWTPDDTADKARKQNEEHKNTALAELGNCERAGLSFAEAYTLALADPSSDNVSVLKRELMNYQQQVAKTAGRIMTHILLPAWRRERQSLIMDAPPAGKADEEKSESKAPLAKDDYVRAAEEFFVLPYLGFIQNILGRVRTIAIAILLLFTATTLALASYPFSPTPALGAIFLVLFVIVGAMVVFVYAEMHRDATLSHITQTKPGQLGFEFWTRIVSFGIGPLIGLLATLFPSIADFVVSWLQPGMETVK